MVDAYASGAYVARHGGSSPLPGTKNHPLLRIFCAREASALRHSREDLKMLNLSQRAEAGEVRRETCTVPVRKKSSPGHNLDIARAARWA